MEIEHELYCIKKIIPSEFELRGYLNQCCQYTGKRSYLEESEMIVDYIESKGFELKDISKIPFNEIIQIMNHCKIFTAFLYFSTSDQFAKYDSPDFGITIENAIMDRYEGIFLDLDCTIPALPNPAEKDELIEFLPKFYNSLQEVKLNYGKILIAYTLGGELLDIFTENGNRVYYNILNDIVTKYNNTKHSAIKTTPSNAYNNNIQLDMNETDDRKETKPKFKINDR